MQANRPSVITWGRKSKKLGKIKGILGQKSYLSRPPQTPAPLPPGSGGARYGGMSAHGRRQKQPCRMPPHRKEDLGRRRMNSPQLAASVAARTSSSVAASAFHHPQACPARPAAVFQHHNVVGLQVRRWAMTSTVLPASRRESAPCTFVSFSTSRLAVASSSRTMGAFFRSVRAMEMRCRSPPESFAPFFPMGYRIPGADGG